MRRFVRRYRIAVATTTVVVLSLLAGIVGTTTGLLTVRESDFSNPDEGPMEAHAEGPQRQGKGKQEARSRANGQKQGCRR